MSIVDESAGPTYGAAADQADDAAVVDRLLWQDAQHMLGRHASADQEGRCVWCGWAWPCPPRRLAERAAVASRRPWRESWTARHDLNGLRTLPSWRTDATNTAASWPTNYTTPQALP